MLTVALKTPTWDWKPIPMSGVSQQKSARELVFPWVN